MNRTNGKIAEQSKKKLAKALLYLMEQYTYEEMTITQIAQEANLSRKTFYRLFKSKEEVLNYIFLDLYQSCFEEMKSKNLTHYWDLVQSYFDYWQTRKELINLFKKHHLLSRFIDGAYQYSFQIYEFVRSKEKAEKFSLQLPYVLAYSIGGMHCMLLKWLESDFSVPSELLIEHLKRGFQSPTL